VLTATGCGSYITFDEFLPALTDGMPLSAWVWEEILSVKRPLLTSTPAPDLLESPQQQSGEEVLAELLGYLAQYPLASCSSQPEGYWRRHPRRRRGSGFT
jgi:hypothetical protein